MALREHVLTDMELAAELGYVELNVLNRQFERMPLQRHGGPA
jgi:hypothetical protein